MFRVRQEQLPEVTVVFTVRLRTAMRRGSCEGLVGDHERAGAPVRQLMLLAAAGLFIGAGCSGSDSSQASPTSVPASAAPTPASPTSIALATTVVPLSISTVATDVAPTTEAQPDPEVAVRAAVDLAQATFSACLVAMPTCDPSTLAVARTGAVLERNSARIEEWNALGYTVRDREAFRYVIESVEVDGSGMEATATVCIADGSRLVMPNAAPDGSDVVVDDEFVSGRTAWQLRLDSDGVWRAFDSSPVGESASEDVCGAG